MLRSCFIVGIVALCWCSGLSADLVVVDLGNDTAGQGDNRIGGGQLIAGETIMDGAGYILTGTLGTGVSFKLTGVASPGAPTSQTQGMGVFGGRANSGIDNNSNNTGGTNPGGDYSEIITFTISDVVGAASVEFDGLLFAFTNEGTEYVSLNEGAIQEADVAAGFYAVTGSTLSVRAPSVNNIIATFGAGAFQDSRYVVDRLRFNVTAVPEPASALFSMMAIGLLGFRRRR